ncbi:Tyrosine-protein phosphatase [Paraconexibacter sp. AEG42_29]|uniref:Tyrosine-protein phosphatase n=1 Tax=Paraconexibacter sp. AEG42_29 TaxID=2997339 RepID=A0AAU7B114_9ACTN
MHDETTLNRTIALDGTVNTRDVGGLPLAGGGQVATGVLLRSDNLQDLSPDDVESLVVGHGVRTVVDLRTEFELRSEGPGPLNDEPRVSVEHHSLYPATGGGTDLDLDDATIKPWGDGQGADLPDETPTVRAYLGYLERRPDSIAAALRAITTTDGAVLVHCAAGKDRTGMVVALALAVTGVPVEAIAADYVETGENIAEIVGRLAGSPTYAREMHMDQVDKHRPPAGTMERLFELLDEQHGGFEAWLRGAGLSDEELAAIRSRLSGA